MDVDVDLERLDREALIKEVRRLRAGIRAHRDSSGHDLCWHHPELWALLPERIEPAVAVPPWPKFIRGCLAYRERWIANSRQRRLRTSNTTFEMLAAASESLGDKCETATRGSIV